MQTPYAIKKQKNTMFKIKTADYTILPDTEDMWATFSNSGAAGTGTGGGIVTFTLPSAKVGMGFHFLVQTACRLRIDPATADSIYLPSASAYQTAGYWIEANAVGEHIELECRTLLYWDVNSYFGTWTVQS